MRHLVLAVVTGALVLLFWGSRMQWHPEMRLWRAFGDAVIVLLFLTLALARPPGSGPGRAGRYRGGANWAFGQR